MSDKPRTRFTVEVTQDDIDRAKKNDSYKCVVAQAIARTIPTANHIEVDTQTIRFTTGDERRIHLTPYVVAGYVVAFDAGDEIHPFSFQLRDPKRVARKTRTAAGAAADRAASAARWQVEKKRKVFGTSAKVPKKDEGDVAAAAKAAYAQERVAHENASTKLSDRSGPKPPPRVFKTKRRAYGHRLLRINHEATELAE